jgi:tRNA (guanine-N7-)-methyltransferase
MRRRKIKGAVDVYYSTGEYGIKPDQSAHEALLDFVKNHSVGLEIGTGRGRFLTDMGLSYPDMRFIGVELKEELLMRAALLAQTKGVDNVRYILGNVEFIKDWLKEIHVDEIYLNFSDPWPKDRHAKRRLTHGAFLKIYRELLVPNGRLIIKTDNGSLYHYTLESLGENGYKIVEATVNLHGESNLTNIMSEYEAKFVSKNMPIYRIIASI